VSQPTEPADHTIATIARQPSQSTDDTSARPVTAEPAARPWRRALFSAAGIWLASTVAHLFVNLYAWRTVGKDGPPFASLGTAWLQFDTTHYVRIADLGYTYSPAAPAWFPLYPMLMKGLNPILPGGTLVAAMVVANVCAFVALMLVHRLTAHEFGEGLAGRTTFYIAAYPMGFFLFAGYNESLFIMLAIGSLYAARRGHWWVAGALAGLASGTRLFGILLLAPLCWEYARQHDWRPRRLRPDVLALALAPAGLVAYTVYCWQRLNDPLAYLHAQDVWQRHYALPGAPLLGAIRQLRVQPALDMDTLLLAYEIGTMLLGLTAFALCLVGPYRLRRDQFYLILYVVIPLVLMLSSEVGWGRSLQSTPRYLMELLPMFVVLSRLGERRIAVDRLYVLTAISLQATFLACFLTASAFVA
jgi:hypothetical protein